MPKSIMPLSDTPVQRKDAKPPMTHRKDANAKSPTKKGWVFGPWLDKRELTGIIANTRSTNPEENEDPPRYLHLLRRHPNLARERFERRRSCSSLHSAGAVFPLSFALEMGAGLEVVREIFLMYPLAATKTVTQNKHKKHKQSSDFPLHLACRLGRVSPEVIQFLAHSAPAIVSSIDSFRHLPLHRLLRNPRRSATVSEVDTLLEIYEGAIERDCGFGTPVVAALKSSRTTKDVVEVLIDRFADRWKDRSAVANNGARYVRIYDQSSVITLRHAEAFSLILPKLRTFLCLPRRWEPEAFLRLMNDLTAQQSLVDLTLHLPPSLLCHGDTDKICDAIQKLLKENTALECLHVDFGHYSRTDESITVDTVQAIKQCLQAVVAGLCGNRSLRACYLSGSILTLANQDDFLRKKVWSPLANVLEESNSTLQWISLAHLRNMPKLPTEGEEVMYWTGLNRCGREQARDPNLSIPELTKLVVKASKQQAPNRDHELDRVSLAYGLLKECPGLWSSI